MMSETRARASLLARWFGSLERNGLSGRRGPPSPATGMAPGGFAGGRGVVGALDGDPDGTNGGAEIPEAPGEAAGAAGGAGDRGVNSRSPDEGDGGVAVAVTEARPIDSGLGREAAGVSTVRGGGGGGDGAGRCPGGVAGTRCDAEPNGGGSQPPCAAGAERGRSCDPDSRGGVAGRSPPPGGVVWPVGAGMEMTPLHTEHRARTPEGGTLAGSTRNMERQSGQLTFIHSLRSCVHRESPAAVPAASRAHRCVCKQYKLGQEDSWG